MFFLTLCSLFFSCRMGLSFVEVVSMLDTSNFQGNMPVNVSLMSVGSAPLHTHKYLQIFYVLDGEIDLTLSFSNYHLKKGDVFVVHYNDIHSVRGMKGKNHVVLLDINTDYFKAEYPDLENRFFVSYLMQSRGDGERFREISRLIEEVVIHFAHDGEGRIGKSVELARRCIDSFYTNFLGFSLNKDLKVFESKISAKPYQMQRVSNVIATIYENYNTKLTLEDVAANLHIDKFYLSHLIKGLTGESFQNLLGMARAEYSEELLLATNMSIFEIALAVGFSNVAYYEKHFQKWYEMTPEAYREKYKLATVLHGKPDVISYPVTPEILENFKEHFQGGHEKPQLVLRLDPDKRVGPSELAPFFEAFDAYCDSLRLEETAYGMAPLLKTPSYYVNYYYSRLFPVRSDTGPGYLVTRSGKDYCLFLFNPPDGREFEAEIIMAGPPCKGRVLEYKIEPANSVLNYWMLLGAPKRVDPEELRAIEAATYPRLLVTMLHPEGTHSYKTYIEKGTASYIIVKCL